ncbi:MAG: hypothetical protein GY874_10110 [Desulfobacteraceae bacterium]|nr:hypothetical protein [Desulfobacteraceae bacterium]
MKLRPHTSHLVELDGALHLLSPDQTQIVDDIEDVKGDKWLVTDLQEAISRQMTVDGPSQYADLMVRRKLQEAGEFEEPVHVISHWKKKRSKNTTDVFFTAVPLRVANYYLETLRQHAGITLVVPIYAVLLKILIDEALNGPVAVVLRHDRFAEVLVGDKKKVYFANRCVAFDNEAERINALWETIDSDISGVEKEHRLKLSKLICLSWPDANEPDCPPDGKLQKMASFQSLNIGVTAKLRTMGKLSLGQSISSQTDKLFFLSRQWAWAANFSLLILTLLFAIGWVYCRQNAEQTQNRLADIEQEIRSFRRKQTNMPDITGYKETLDFVREIEKKKSLPSYTTILKDLTWPEFANLELERLKLNYMDDYVRVELYGLINSPFDKAHDRYRNFLNLIESRGYSIEEKNFETKISESQVVLKLKRPVS